MLAIAVAARLATRAHAGQVDKSGQPYIEHCQRVSESVEGVQTKVVAWLHDILEDTDVTESELRSYFNVVVVDAVVALTHPDGERNDIYWKRICSNPLARQVKIADIYDNLRPERLALLDPKTVARLTTKYNKALTVITQED